MTVREAANAALGVRYASAVRDVAPQTLSLIADPLSVIDIGLRRLEYLLSDADLDPEVRRVLSYIKKSEARLALLTKLNVPAENERDLPYDLPSFLAGIASAFPEFKIETGDEAFPCDFPREELKPLLMSVIALSDENSVVCAAGADAASLTFRRADNASGRRFSEAPDGADVRFWTALLQAETAAERRGGSLKIDGGFIVLTVPKAETGDLFEVCRAAAPPKLDRLVWLSERLPAEEYEGYPDYDE